MRFSGALFYNHESQTDSFESCAIKDGSIVLDRD